MAVQPRPLMAPISERSDYRHLGIAHDAIHRRESAEHVERYKLKCLGWETALTAARKFSNGRPCVAGEGSGTGLARQPQVQGASNWCFWVKVEEEPQQWVVRFPLKGMVRDETTIVRMRSEIATLRFLHRFTKVPVPAIVGYNADENEFPPFLIMKSVEGMRMTYLLAINISDRILDQVCKDLARIHLELLSHPSDRIGMLQLTEDIPDVPSPTIGPYSLDATEHERDGVFTPKAEPFTSALEYYKYKCSVWTQLLQQQRNAISSVGNGRRKLFDETLLNKGIDRLSRPQGDLGPFYLVHPDLHASNVILHPKTLHVAAIIDWEGACFLPLTSSCAPPKALFPCQIPDLVPGSDNYRTYYNRARRYLRIFSAEGTKVLLESGFASAVTAKMASCLEDDMVFLIWALDDVRTVDQVVWQHLAPRFFPDLRARLNATIARFPDDMERALAVNKLFTNFAFEQLTAMYGEIKDKDNWIKGKLEALNVYKKQLRANTGNT